MAGAFTSNGKQGPRRLVQALLSLVLLLSAAAVLGRLIDVPWLASYGDGNIPMAPVTSVCFAVLAASLLLVMRAGAGRFAYAAGSTASAVVTACGLVVWLGDSNLGTSAAAAIRAATVEDFYASPLAQVSPVTGMLFVLAGLALAATLVSRMRSASARSWLLCAAASGALVAAVATLIVISYVIEAPVFYDSNTLPMALPTAIAFVLQGIAQVAATVAFPSGSGQRGMRLRDVSVPTQLGMGLGGIVLAVLVFGYVVHLQNDVLWAQTQALYEHSIVATAAVHDLGSNAWQTHDKVAAGQFYGEAERRHRALEVAVVGIFAAVLLASAVVGWLLSRQISRPVRELTWVAAQFGQGNFEVRSASASANEFGVLASTLNQMADTIQASAASAAGLTARLQCSEASLAAQNRELEAFSYSVSHDLRAPLRNIDGFSRVLLEDHDARLDVEGRESLRQICAATQQMGQLIDDLLRLARLSRTPLIREHVDLSALVREIAADLMRQDPNRQIELIVAEGVVVGGDRRLLRVALTNLLDNAWKFTRKRSVARIEFGSIERDGCRNYFVGDNGVGFDPAYADQLFGAFQRMHNQDEFPGSGIGLATVNRVVVRHGGWIWAHSALDQGARFSFTLGPTLNQLPSCQEVSP